MTKAPADLRSLARSHTDMAVRVLKSIAQQAKSPPAARVQACQVLLDRGWGKPEQPHVGGDKDIRVIIRNVIDGGDDEPGSSSASS